MRRLSTAMLLAAVAPWLPLAAQRPDSLPLKPTRSVDFTTSEGTWISLDVSPDGQTIVFELLGDLYTMPGGMTPREALRVGTRDGAYGIGMDRDLGSLEPGKLADLIVLDANRHGQTQVTSVRDALP